MSPRANYTDQATAACRRSDCQLLRIEGATWSAWRIPTAVYSRFSRQEPLFFYQVAPQLYSRGWVDLVPDPLLFFLVVPGIEPGPPDLLPRTLTTRPQRKSHSLQTVRKMRDLPTSVALQLEEIHNLHRVPQIPQLMLHPSAYSS
jgi:hypothetical protein